MPKGPEREERYRLLGVVPKEVETPDERDPDDTVFTWPHLLIRHAVVAGAVLAVVFILGIAFDAPLQAQANPNLTPPVAKAPWYFAGLQELLAHFHPMVAGVLIPGAVIAGLVVLPYIDRNPSTEGRQRKVVILTFLMLCTVFFLLTVVGAFFRGPGWTWVWPWDQLFLEL